MYRSIEMVIPRNEENIALKILDSLDVLNYIIQAFRIHYHVLRL